MVRGYESFDDTNGPDSLWYAVGYGRLRWLVLDGDSEVEGRMDVDDGQHDGGVIASVRLTLEVFRSLFQS